MKTSDTSQKSPLNVAFGLAVKSMRKSLAITQEELAWRAGLHRTYVTNVERGVCNLSLESISKLAKALGTSMAALLVDVEVLEARQMRAGRIEFGPPKSPVEILLATEDPQDAELAIRAMRESGLTNRIQVVYDATEVIDFVFCTGPYAGRTQENQPSLILLDLKLPKTGGIDVLRQIKSDARTRSIPVIIISTPDRGREIAECSRLGAENWIARPLNFDRLSQVIPKLNFRWLLLKQRAATVTPPPAAPDKTLV